MSYHIKKKGKKYQIVRDEDNVVVGTSDSKAKAQRSIGYRMEAIAEKEKKEGKKYKKVVDNKMKGAYGETDFEKKQIRINKKRHAKGKPHDKRTKKNRDGSASIIDTIVHEEMHAKHPKMKERTVRKLTPKKVLKMSVEAKKKKYSQYKPTKVM